MTAIEEKAERLLLSRALTVHATEATVQGDHGTYRLYRDTDRWRCTCRSYKKCSHILAVERITG